MSWVIIDMNRCTRYTNTKGSPSAIVALIRVSTEPIIGSNRLKNHFILSRLMLQLRNTKADLILIS